VPPQPQMRRLALAAILYLVLYSLAAYSDLWTTRLVLSQTGAHEGNSFVRNGEEYLPSRALMVNLAGAVIMAACVIFAANHAEQVEIKWLRRPIASFGKIYLNPWSTRAIGVSPLHMLSTAMAFLALRVVAAGNNLLIHFYGFAPIGALISVVAQHTSELAAFAVVIVTLFYLLAIAVSPLAARLLSSWQSGPALL
jgi:hypothetical protein